MKRNVYNREYSIRSTDQHNEYKDQLTNYSTKVRTFAIIIIIIIIRFHNKPTYFFISSSPSIP